MRVSPASPRPRPLLTRRRFLAAGSAALIAAWARAADPEPSRRAPVIDTHLHCFAGRDDPHFAYHPRAPYEPQEAATPEHLLRLMDAAGVDYAVVVHPEPYQDDHRYLEHCLTVGDGRLKGTCLVFADRPGSVEKLPALVRANRGRIVAIRIHAYAPDRLPPFGTPELRNLWKTAVELGLAVQLHFEPRYAPGFEPYLREFPTARVIIDHLGRPFQGTPEEHRTVVRWARLPGTVMKLSAILEREQYPHRDIAPVIRSLTDAWEPDRLIYGGGFNARATPESYRGVRTRLGEYLSHLSDADQAKVFGGTAGRLFGFQGT